MRMSVRPVHPSHTYMQNVEVGAEHSKGFSPFAALPSSSAATAATACTPGHMAVATACSQGGAAYHLHETVPVYVHPWSWPNIMGP